MSRVEGTGGGAVPPGLPRTSGDAAARPRPAEPRAKGPGDGMEYGRSTLFDTPREVASPAETSTAARADYPRPTFAYTVRKGDTLSQLARRYGFATSELVAVNPQLADPDKLAIGQVVNIPLPASVCWALGVPASLEGLSAEQVRKVDQVVSERSFLSGWSWSDIGHGALDLVGFVPGWGEAADLANAGWYAAKGEYLNAGLSLISVVPVIGDIVGKGGKLVARLGPDAAARILKLLEKLDVVAFLNRFKDHPKLGKHIARIQEAIAGWIDGLKKTAGGTRDFVGKIGGVDVVLPGVKTRTITYVKRSDADRDALRAVFNKTERAAFLKELGRKNVAELKRAGLSDADIALVARGNLPQGWQVHHKLPLDDGGTNAASNLVMIKNDPFHKAITNRQNELTRGMKAGESRAMDFPEVPGVVYPPVPQR